MSKKYGIRWREADEKEVERVIRNFNQKLYRVQKRQPELAPYLPARLKKADVIASIHTRADFNRILNSYRRFSRKGAEKPIHSTRGAKLTTWEEKEYKLRERLANRKKAAKLKKLQEKPVTSRGTPTGATRKEMGKIKEVDLKPSDFNIENLSKKEWEYKKKQIDSQLDDLQDILGKQNMKSNYIKGLTDAGFSVDLVDMVRNTDLDDFIDTINTDTEADFDFIYDPLDHAVKEEALQEVWGKKE